MVEVVINQNDGFVSITAAGGETTLAGDFPIYEKAHVTIKRTRSGTITTGVLNTDYTIADNQLEVTAGFTAVLAGTWTPAVAGDVYTLLLDVPESRTTDFNAAGDFLAGTLNEELDLETQMIQQLRRDVDKSARLPDTSTLTELFLPTPEAGALLQWNDDEDGLQNVAAADVDLATVSTFWEGVLDETTAAASRSLLGAAASGAVTTSDITMTTARLLGRTTASTGAIEEISAGAGLTLSGGSLLTSANKAAYTAAVTCGTSGTITLDSNKDSLTETKIPLTDGTFETTVSGRLEVASVSSPSGTIRISLNTASSNLTEISGASVANVVLDSTNTAMSSIPLPAVIEEGASLIVCYLPSLTATGLGGDIAAQVKAGTIIYVRATYITNS